MIRKFIKIGFESALPLLILLILMKFKIINEIINTNFLFPLVSVLFFIESFTEQTLIRKKINSLGF